MLDSIYTLPSILLVSLIYLVYWLSKYQQKNHHHNPTTSHKHQLTSPPNDISEIDDSPIWIFERSGITISLWTQSFNALPKDLLNKLNVKLVLFRRLKIIYNVGIGLGLLGMMVAFIGSLWAVISVWKEVWLEISLHTIQVISDQVEQATTQEIVKRALDIAGEKEIISIQKSGKGKWDFAGGLQPLIPGLTMPWTHLPTLILALLINQLIHEFGHAISAALDDIQPSRFSLSLHAGIPSMMISFPSTVDNLDPNAKMRLATSGPFHNLLTWFSVWLLTFSGIGSILWSDRNMDGIIVQDVHWNSPLYDHLQAGSLITHLDDIPLFTSSTSSPDQWSEYLLSDRIGDVGRGWCMDKTSFLSQPLPPCQTNSTSSSHSSKYSERNQDSKIMFRSTYGPSKGEERCLSPHPILDIKSTKCPCPDSRWVCIRPFVEVIGEGDSSSRSDIIGGTENSNEHGILRIGVKENDDQNIDEKVILWIGPRAEVYNNVEISNKGARGWKAGIRWADLFFKYISTISLSLFLFNLLPLPLTDGSQLLVSLLEWRSIVRPSTSNSSHSLQATLTQPSESEIRETEGARSDVEVYRQYEIDSDDEIDEEEMIGRDNDYSEASTRKDVVWKRWVRRAIQSLSMVLVGIWAIGWFMLFLLRSS
ncbi:uncharacterized protein IL334_006020 [Kwoniella shivajii]|uniref:Endopeptidase S2P n=1 Tax=Kwoniella shivajii TaxID=564305 RepID=A0ABZ1D4R2_9TREE|nr:hypothetical protein IL334_006020 [Kwoniella shivajii]